jgi:hypothetical protein
MTTDDLKAKIRKLLDRTVDRGCTEAEAEAAMDAAARLMREHGLTRDDLVMTMERCRRPVTKGSSPRDWVLMAIAKGLGCSVLRIIGSDAHAQFYGAEPAPQIAAYIADRCLIALETEPRQFRQTTYYKRKRTARAKTAAGRSFIEGMCIGLANKISDRFDADSQVAACQRAEQWMRNQEGEASEAKSYKASQDRQTRFHGSAAATRTDLSEGVGGSRPTLRLGRDG